MARRHDLEKIAEQHGLLIGTIADLIRYRIEHEKTVERAAEAMLPTEFGEFRLIAYRDAIRGELHLAMVRGEIDPERPTLVRVHIYNPIQDLTASIRKDSGWPLRDALRRVADAGEGVVIVLANQVDNDELVRQVFRYAHPINGGQRPAKSGAVSADFRQIGLGAQILGDLGVRKMRVMSHPRRYHALSGFGLEVVEYVT
jgi:3,4-dihydroxy 2-butanone 4-phosphate synthase/GTP cyclohydrolase II